MTDVDRLHRALDADPSDRTLRLALADAYEEAGDDVAAECMRWLAWEDMRPEYIPHYGPTECWHWWMTGDTDHPNSVLPRSLKPFSPASGWGLPSRRQAEEWLINLWGVARGAGWVPPSGVRRHLRTDHVDPGTKKTYIFSEC